MSYQYSNSNYTYNSPLVADRPKVIHTTSKSTTSSISNYSTKSTSTSSQQRNNYDSRQSGNKLQTDRFKSNELPWSSLLPSSSRYRTSDKPVYSNVSISDSPRLYNKTHDSSATSTSTGRQDRLASTSYSSTISGRSLFDYSAPRTAINTPASRIYDGQLRRTVTARYNRVSDIDPGPSNTIAGQNRLKVLNSTADETLQRTSSQTKTTLNPLVNNSGSRAPIAASLSSKTSSNLLSIPSKPLRSSSLKLRTSYTNILDQLTSTTLARLRLGTSSTSGDSMRKKKNHCSATSSASKATLDIVPDESEPEEDKQEQRVKSTYKILISDSDKIQKSAVLSKEEPQLITTSPGSSSSGISSSSNINCEASSLTQSPISSYQVAKSPNSTRFKFGANIDRIRPTDSDNSEDDNSTSKSSSYCDIYVHEKDSEQKVQSKNMTEDDHHIGSKIQADNLIARDNIEKTGAILSELQEFNEDSDQYDERVENENVSSRSRSQDILTNDRDLNDSQSDKQVEGANESELIIGSPSNKQYPKDSCASGSFSSALDWYRPAANHKKQSKNDAVDDRQTSQNRTNRCGSENDDADDDENQIEDGCQLFEEINTDQDGTIDDDTVSFYFKNTLIYNHFHRHNMIESSYLFSDVLL